MTMFLHAGASLHGHEYSQRPAQSPTSVHNAPSRILLRSALGTPRSPTPASDAEGRARPSPPAQRHSLSNDIPAVSPRPSPLQRRRPLSEYTPRKEHCVRFEEPIVDPDDDPTPAGHAYQETASEDEATLSLSELSDRGEGTRNVVKKRRRRRSPTRRSTNFLLAQPPPGLRTKQRRFVHIRPRLLLQLQQLSPDTRPTPIIDVLPSSLVAGTVIVPRLARRFPRLFLINGELGPDDLILAKSDDYNAPPLDDSSDSEGLDKRDLIAIISPSSTIEDKVELVLDDGTVWTAQATANGSYDFTHVDEAGHTTTARWAKRCTHKTESPPPTSPTSTVSSTSHGLQVPDYKFTFSVLDPLSRRHPIMATLTAAKLEVLDQYTTISPSSGRYPPSRPFSPTDAPPSLLPGEAAADATVSSPKQRITRRVDETTRTLITVSAVWVSLHHGQGWPAKSSRPVQARSTSAGERTSSLTSASASTDHTVCRVLEMPQTPIRPARLCKRHPSGTSVDLGSPIASLVPRRAMSTGAAFMQRRQAKLPHEQPASEAATERRDIKPTPDTSSSDSGDAPDQGKDILPAKRGFYRRLVDWGHRITHKKHEVS